MAKKDKIIKNFNKYSVEEIAGAIREGQLTIYDLSKAGLLTPLMRRRIEAELAKPVASRTPEPEYRQPEPEPVRYEQPRRTPEPEYRQPEPEPVRYEQPRRAPEPEYHRPEPALQQRVVDSVPPIPRFDEHDSEDTRIVNAPQPPQIRQEAYPLDNNDNEVATVDNKPKKKRKKRPDPRIIPDDIIDNHGMFRRPFSFRGRIRRTEYGLTILIYMLWTVMLFAAGISNNVVIMVAVLLLFLPLIWLIWAEGAKRCHDLGHSGWFQLIPFYSFVMLFCEGERCSNRFGTMTKK